jgi:hypothetical protein
LLIVITSAIAETVVRFGNACQMRSIDPPMSHTPE